MFDPIRLKAYACLLVFLGASGVQGGRLVAIGDDWLLSDFAFDLNSQQATQLASTIADFLADGGTGNFLVVSNSPPEVPFGPRGVNGPELAQVMQGLGHSWTIDATAELSVASLSSFDAVFFSGQLGSGAGNAGVLGEYVDGGGGVVVVGGTKDFGDATAESQAWGPLLSRYGLSFGSVWIGESAGTIASVPAVVGETPPGQGVSSFAWSIGQLATVSETEDPLTRIAIRGDFSAMGGGPQGDINDIIAVYESQLLTGDYNGDGQVDTADYTTWRDHLGQAIDLPGDLTPGSVDASDYAVWRTNFGGAGIQSSTARIYASNAVPEPCSLGVLIIWLLGVRPVTRSLAA